MPIRIGFIGAGGIAIQRHLPGLRAIDDVELVAVANRSRASSERVASEWGFRTVCDDWRDVVRSPEVDAVFIGTPPYLHCEATLAALDAGKHVFCQARMARDYAEALRMYERARHSDRVTMVCPPPHAMAGDYVVKRLLSEGLVGRLYHVTVRGLGTDYADPDAPLHWRQDVFLSGFNTLALGMWIEVLHRWVGHFASITAQTAYHVPRRPRPGSVHPVDVRVADSIGIVGTMKNGAIAVIDVSGSTHFAGSPRIELFGSQGSLVYEVRGDRILAARRDEPDLRQVHIPPEELRRWTAEADFINAIREAKPVTPDFEEGLRYMEVTEAIYRAARTGHTVTLPLLP
ncbi:MAG: Gfo/Idh/MocA family oxidoreductase [Chloroflexota bacterium]|nr:Gfo/Idh/MocA family oxidoreductase [Chloroflexota bacterium]